MTGSHLAWRPLVVWFHCPTLWCKPKERAKDQGRPGPLNFFILFYTNERKDALAVTPLVRSRSHPWSRARKTPAAKGSVRGTSRARPKGEDGSVTAGKSITLFWICNCWHWHPWGPGRSKPLYCKQTLSSALGLQEEEPHLGAESPPKNGERK